MAEEVDYTKLTVAQLKEEIERRNEGRDEDDEIIMEGNKPDLIAALQMDDEEHADEDESDEDDADEADEDNDDDAPVEGNENPKGEKSDATGTLFNMRPKGHGPSEYGDELRGSSTENNGQENYGASSVAPKDGIVLKWDEEEKFEADDHDTFVTVTKNVYREFYPRNSRRPSYKLLYTKGQQVPKGMLNRVMG